MSERSIEYVALADVLPAERNPKAHALEDIDASYDRFGYVEPIVRDERTGRLLEIDPRYVDVTCRRWAAVTGEPAILEATGEAFHSIP